MASVQECLNLNLCKRRRGLIFSVSRGQRCVDYRSFSGAESPNSTEHRLEAQFTIRWRSAEIRQLKLHQHLRIAYHNCFNRWYSDKFLKGKWDEAACVVEWKKYRDCPSEHSEDKHLSRFLEAEVLFDLSEQTDSEKAASDFKVKQIDRRN